MAYPKGKPNPNAGRPKGALNKESRMFLDALAGAVEAMQADANHNLLTWGKKNPNEFWKIAAKLLPSTIQGDLDVTSNGETISISINALPKQTRE